MVLRIDFKDLRGLLNLLFILVLCFCIQIYVCELFGFWAKKRYSTARPNIYMFLYMTTEAAYYTIEQLHSIEIYEMYEVFLVFVV